LFIHSLRGVFGLGRSAKSKVLPVGLFSLMCIPAVILAVVTVILAGQGALTEPPLPYARYAMVMQAVLAIFVAVQAPQAVSLDLRFNTLPLYLSRPVQRIDYVVAKYAALAAGVFILLAVPLLVMYVGALLAEFPAGPQTADLLFAFAGAALFSLVLSGISLVIASLTPRRGFGIAGIITVLALSFAVVTALQGLIGFEQGDMTTAGWLGLFSPMTLVDGVQVWAFGAESSVPAAPQDDATGFVFTLVTLVVIAGCFGTLVRRYRKVRL
jgi:ABC-2 type transport system permease protein